MPRFVILALALVAVGPAFAEPIRPVARPAAAPLIDPVSLKVNEAAARRLDAESKARDQAWDAKVRRTMSGVCRGC